MVTLSPEFNQAVLHSKSLTEKPSNDDLLSMYALFKQATQEPPIADAPNPGAFDLKGRAKKRAWQKIVDAGVTPEQAQIQYIKLIEEFKVKYKYDADKKPEDVGSS